MPLVAIGPLPGCQALGPLYLLCIYHVQWVQHCLHLSTVTNHSIARKWKAEHLCSPNILYPYIAAHVELKPSALSHVRPLPCPIQLLFEPSGFIVSPVSLTPDARLAIRHAGARVQHWGWSIGRGGDGSFSGGSIAGTRKPSTAN
jgi:hypothetical protein